MVLELNRSYAVAVVMNSEAGEGNSGRHATTPANQNSMNQNSSQRRDEFDDPYYLHITENPNLILVSPPLSELNYASWSRSMRIALEVKNKYGFVDGSIPSPGELDPKYAVWRRCNNMICSWILKSLNSTIAESVLYFERATDIWSALKRRYSQADLHKIAELQYEIFRNVQGNISGKSHPL